MKIELEHLAPYLPYGLKILSNDNEIQTLFGIRDESYFIKETRNNYAYGDISDLRAILRPISELTIKFIENDSVLREFQPEFIIGNRYEWNYAFVQRLFELHLDYFGLIEKSLAISIHDVEFLQKGNKLLN